MLAAVDGPNEGAQRLFAPIAESYDRYARLLSLGQDPRWRSFLVSRVSPRPTERILDVACGTGAVAIELARRYGCSVVGVDISGPMLAEGRRRIARAGLEDRIRLEEGRAEELPFDDASFDSLTFTYLLRYVGEPAEALRELARVVRAGGTVASLEFAVPQSALARKAWDLYVDVALPALGRVISPGWEDVGRFLGPSIRSFSAGYPLARQLADWRAAGIGDVGARRLTAGAALVVWGRRVH